MKTEDSTVSKITFCYKSTCRAQSVKKCPYVISVVVMFSVRRRIFNCYRIAASATKQKRKNVKGLLGYGC